MRYYRCFIQLNYLILYKILDFNLVKSDIFLELKKYIKNRKHSHLMVILHWIVYILTCKLLWVSSRFEQLCNNFLVKG